ncbi:MAG TPA: ice-binding family protein [Polyangiaceae bacterium]|nr:ice-binding family protein [Polyangiaceae bacterium]
MLPSTLFVRRLLLTALPSFALIAVACSDNDGVEPGSAGGNAGATSFAGQSGEAGKAGSSGATGKAGESGKAGETGASGAAGSLGSAGSSGADAEAGAGGEVPGGDQIAPTPLSSSPINGAIGVASQSAIRVTFSEVMDSSTLTSESFRVTSGGVAVPGQISYFQQTATFTPDAPLALNSAYQIAVSVAATDLAGNALAQAYTSSFTTSALAALGPAPVKLGTAGNYAILAKSAISNVPTSAITGHLGLSPAAASYVTGFPLTKAGTFWTSPQIVGRVFAADNDAPTPSNLTTAVANMQTAYTDAAGRPTPDFTDLGAGAIGGLTLIPGLYKWASSLTIPTDVTLAGAANDVWIFQVTGDLKLSAAKAMTLSGGAQAKNIFWQVAGAVDLGTTSHAEGIVLCKTAITLGTGASINGRLLAQTAVSIASSTVTQPAQ